MQEHWGKSQQLVPVLKQNGRRTNSTHAGMHLAKTTLILVINCDLHVEQLTGDVAIHE